MLLFLCFTFEKHGKMKVWISARGTVGSSHQEPDLHKVPVKLISADLGDNCRQRSQSWAGTVSRWVSDCQWMNEWMLLERPVFDLWSCRVFLKLGELVHTLELDSVCVSVPFAPVVPPELLLCVTVSMLNPLHLEVKHHFSNVLKWWNKLLFFPGVLLTGLKRFPEKWRKICCYLSCAAQVLPLILYNRNEARDPNWVTCCFKVNPLLLHFYWIRQQGRI